MSAKPLRPKKDDIVYIQRDLEAIKHTLDKVLRPYKTDVKSLKEHNASLLANICRKERDIEAIMRIIAHRHPESVDDALSVMLNPSRRGSKTFLRGWRHRLGVERGGT
jgi:hypothetical protein